MADTDFTARNIAFALSLLREHETHDGAVVFDLNESEAFEDGTVRVEGRTENGRYIAFRLTVDRVEVG